MLNQWDMTEEAKKVLTHLSRKWTTPGEISSVAGTTVPHCQMILTQLAMAGMAEDMKGEGEQFRRCG